MEDPDENYIFQTVVDSLPVTAKLIAEHTRKDAVLVKVLEYTLSGWTESCIPERCVDAGELCKYLH